MNLNFRTCPKISIPTIADIFEIPPSLRHLSIDFTLNHISEEGVKYLSKGIGDLPHSLQSLHLGFLNIEINPENDDEYEDEDAIDSLWEAFPKLTFLKSFSLNISGCDDIFAHHIVTYIGDAVISSESLRNISLDLSNNDQLFYDERDLCFCEYLEKLKSIQNLSINCSNSYISGLEIEEMAEPFADFTSLESITLDFTSCDLSWQDEGVVKLRKVLDSLPKLKQCSIKL